VGFDHGGTHAHRLGELVSAGLTLRALLLADHIYRDEGSGKYVIAGTFHQLNVPGFPTTFARSVGLFVSLSGLTGATTFDLEMVEVATGECLMRAPPIEIACPDPAQDVQLALEVPPMPLPRSGRYAFRLLVNGTCLGEANMRVCGPATQEPAAR
jgi:hypothetical protein